MFVCWNHALLNQQNSGRTKKVPTSTNPSNQRAEWYTITVMSPEVESPCSRSKTTLKQLKATNTRTQTEKKNTLTFELPILPEVTLNLRCKLASSFPYFMARDVSIFFSLREKLKCHSAAKKQRSLEKQKKTKIKMMQLLRAQAARALSMSSNSGWFLTKSVWTRDQFVLPVRGWCRQHSGSHIHDTTHK